MIGDGPLRHRIQKFIAVYKLEQCVHVNCSFVPYSQYLRLMNEADIFIHPSVTAKDGDSEGGAPTAILEAQAMGMPVLSTVHADIPNIVAPEQSALLSPEKDFEKLSDNLLSLLENQDQWVKMGSIGREFVQQNHDIRKEVVLLEQKYQQLFIK